MERRPTQSRYVLLGLLEECPGSGYDLRRRIETSIGFFWQESWGQIYPALRAMEAEELVSARHHEGEGRPDRRIYTITQKGIAELEAWLAQSEIRRTTPRNELLLRLFFGHRAPHQQNLRHIKEQRQFHLNLIHRYEEIHQHVTSAYPDDPNLPYWLITLRHGILHARAELAWCEEAARALAQLEPTSNGSASDTLSRNSPNPI